MQQIFQINTFTSDLFAGNSAVVCPLQEWADAELKQRIASESGHICAFFTGNEGHYQIRWFTPRAEIQGICGHGTLAAAFVILNELGDSSEEIVFHVAAGELRVGRRNAGYVLDLPALKPTPCPLPEQIGEILSRKPDGPLGALDLIAIFSAKEHVSRVQAKHEVLD